MNDSILSQSEGLVKQEGSDKRVSARELYKSLGVSNSYRFSDWFKTNSKMFAEGTDYEGVDVTTPYNPTVPDKVQTLIDYSMTLDMAKHIALMSGTQKGAEIRQYFIEVEKQANQPQKATPMLALKQTFEVLENHDERLDTLEEFKHDYEENRPIDGEMPLELEKARKHRVMEIVGGKGTKAYEEFYTDILRNKVFRDYSDRFMVARYRDTKVKDFQDALAFLENWEPSKETRYAVEYANMQTTLDI